MSEPRDAFCRQHAGEHAPLADLAGLLRHCSPDAGVRGMAATATLLALVQTGGPSVAARPPGFLLVNAGGLPKDPLDGLAASLTGMEGPEPTGPPQYFDSARRWMYRMVNEAQAARHAARPDHDGYVRQRVAEFAKWRAQAFGGGRVGFYARRHDEQLGWISDSSGHLVLRIDGEADHAAFRADVLGRSDKLLEPSGYGASLQKGPKLLSVAGSLHADAWEEPLVSGIVEQALPVLFLPHAADAALRPDSALKLQMVASTLETEARQTRRVPEQAQAAIWDGDPWLAACLARLRRRLVLFPPEYEFFVQRMLRGLPEWCWRIAGMAAMDGSAKRERHRLWKHLHLLSFHGIFTGIEALGWHGYGFDAGGSRADALKLLCALRGRGPMARRDLQRKVQTVSAEKRDAILERLEREGLVACGEGNRVEAAPFAAYLRGIAARSGVAAPVMKWPDQPRQPAAKQPAPDIVAGLRELLGRNQGPEAWRRMMEASPLPV